MDALESPSEGLWIPSLHMLRPGFDTPCHRCGDHVHGGHPARRSQLGTEPGGFEYNQGVSWITVVRDRKRVSEKVVALAHSVDQRELADPATSEMVGMLLAVVASSD